MPETDLTQTYLEEVCSQIRWKKAHSIVRRELTDHLEDQQEAFLAYGMAVDEAEVRAVQEMGDAELIGSQLDRSYRPRPEWGMITLATILLIVGFIARIYIVDHIEVHYLSPTHLPTNIFWLCAAIVSMAAAYFLDYTILIKHSYSISAVCIVVMLIFSNTSAVRYAQHYLILLCPVLFTAILWRYPYAGYRGLLGIYAILLAMTFAASWMRGVSGILYGGIGLLMLTVAILKGSFKVNKPLGLGMIYAPIALLATWLILETSALRRIEILFHPELEPFAAGYVGVKLHEILAGAKFVGKGTAMPTADFMPDAITDHMLTFFIHTFGWVVLAAILVLFGTILIFACKRIRLQQSQLGRMVASTVAWTLALQSMLHIFNNVVGALVYFCTLPLLSYGNVALVVNAFLVGLLLSVFRNDDVVRDSQVRSEAKVRPLPRIRLQKPLKRTF